MCRGSVFVSICDLCVRWLCGMCVRFSLVGFAFLRVSLCVWFRITCTPFVTGSNIPGRCPHAILRKRYKYTSVIHRAVVRTLLVPLGEVFPKKVILAHVARHPSLLLFENRRKIATRRCGRSRGNGWDLHFKVDLGHQVNCMRGH